MRVFDFKPTGSLTVRNQTLRALIAAADGTRFPIPVRGASIFTAVEEQFGLKLRDTRAPLETLVTGHAELPAPD